MSYSAQGTLHVKNDTEQVTSTFSKREFVLQIEDGKYPQYVKFELTGDRVDQLNSANVGDVVDVDFNLRGREWADKKTGVVKYFNSCNAWRVTVVNASHRTESAPAPTEDDDSIPF